LNPGRFRLDSLYQQWCTGQDRFPDGRWKLSTFEEAIATLLSAWGSWNEHLNVINRWQRAHPTSEAALYAEAVYWHTYAWNARGTAYARSVSKEAWEIFRERLLSSRKVLDSLRTKASNCPAPYATLLSVATDMGARESELRAIFAEGLRLTTEYHQIYFEMARHYQPKWGGTVAAYEKFALEAADNSRRFEGMGMYSRIYWIVDDEGGLPFRDGNQLPPYWKPLRQGYEDLVRLYPSSLHNLGKFAGVACRSTDGALYRTLRSKISGYEASAQMFDSIDVCDRRHKWATSK